MEWRGVFSIFYLLVYKKHHKKHHHDRVNLISDSLLVCKIIAYHFDLGFDIALLETREK